jgi:hypothetical protein
MKPSNSAINANMLAKALDDPPNRSTAIIKGPRGITEGNCRRQNRKEQTNKVILISITKIRPNSAGNGGFKPR